MLKLVLALCTLSIAFAQVAEFGQCGGQGYSGSTSCASGLSCYRQSIYYSQCLKSCPAGWDCSSGSQTQAPTQAASTTKAPTQVTTQASLGTVSSGKFPNCQFRFGMAFDGNNRDYSVADYLTIWIGSPSTTHGTNFNPYWHGEMVKTAMKNNKMVVYYGYIIAFMARAEWGLKDCDVGTPSLCQRGSDYIRGNRAAIVAKYKSYAAETAALLGSAKETVWLIEPDFWQYYGDVAHQQNGALSGTYMRQFFDDIAVAIKSHLPNARISWDISAWLSESAMTTWWGFFKTSVHIDYLHTSGGQSRADIVNIKQNELNWAFMSTLTGKRIIADTGYGVAGGSSGHTNAFDDVINLTNRIKDGVISVTQANPRSDWGSILTQLKTKLPKFC